MIFKTSTNYTHRSFDGRIQSVGNPSEGDGSVRLRDLKMEDEGTYGCQVEFHWEMYHWSPYLYCSTFEAIEGKRTILRVEVRPKIMDVWREFVNSSTSWRLFCEGEAKPRPTITWWNPHGFLLNGSETAISPNNQNELQKIISSYNITGEDPEGKYSCLVQNRHGTVKRFLFYGEFEGTRGITGIVIGCSSAIVLILLLLFVLLYFLYKKQGNPAEGNSTQADAELHESGQRHEASYMALKKKHCDESQSQLYETL
uniref:sialic acid-binding Ig-like lectin 15 n=1 Tax=Myxine glutinosa TaxID=7769 RepID=UPI00358F8726